MNFKGFDRDALTQFREQANRGSNTYVRIGDGKTKIRFFVSPNEPNSVPFHEVHMHWYPTADGNKRTLLCTQRTQGIHQRPCPICALVNKLYKSQNAEMVDLAKNIKPARSFMQYGFVATDKDGEWKGSPDIISIPKTLMQQIIDSVSMSDEYINLWDIDEGYPITVNRAKGDGQFQYVYTVLPARKSMSLSTEPFLSAVKETKSISTILQIPDEEAQRKAVEEITAAIEGIGTLASSSDDETDTLSVSETSSVGSLLSEMS